MKKVVFVLGILFVFVSLSLAEGPNSSSSDPTEIQNSIPTLNNTSQWVADQNKLSQLSLESPISHFFIRPPKDYSLTRDQGPEGAELYTWRSQRRKDETYAYLMLTIVTPPAEEKKDYSSQEALEILLAGIEERRDNWKQTNFEQGKINGMDFVRAYWTGTDKASGKEMSGFMYVSIDGETIVQISSQDLKDEHEALKIAEASVLTFHK